jgi:hypothetical protein
MENVFEFSQTTQTAIQRLNLSTGPTGIRLGEHDAI